ncbi:MAG: endonuclease MutS2 [Nitrospirae bacterium]|nr:endonuclease MutS2 [Nitrospirota bacterium]
MDLPAADGSTRIAAPSFKLLEFDKLLGIISAYSHSDASGASIMDIRPLGTKAGIEKRLGQVREVMRIIQESRPLKLSRFSDILPLLAKTRPEGAVLDPHELSAFIPVLNIMAEISLQLGEEGDLPFLKEVAAGLAGFPDILKILERSVDSEGNILDSASFSLSELRAQVRKQESRIRKRLDEMVRDGHVAVFLQDDFITTRSGRWVVPVRMDSKGQVPGIVHDVSKSGETAFVEPLAIINLSNELENLIAGQKAEEIRILRNLSSNIRAAADELEYQYGIIVYLDVLSSIAQFAERLHMQIPRINEAGAISLADARHPLLTLAFRRAGSTREVVPLEIRLGGATTVMVITGSNAGGKTIAIKTVGLLLLMALSGMPVPAGSSSSFPLVHNLLIDIGDEQSIEGDLSTFSAHISNISGILKKADAKTVALIDELGTGTDPDEGAALACAVLKELRSSGALTFATTHLTDIKGFVHRTEGMLNASMEFDQKTFTPLYKLRSGEPGQSHALEIARKYGLPDSIIDSAKGMLSGIKVEFDNLIADLNEKRAWYENEMKYLVKQRAELEEKSRSVEGILSGAESRQKELLARAYQEASDVISDVKRQMYALLEEARKKDRAAQREAIRQAAARQEEIAAKLREYDTGAPGIEDIKEGDVVFIKALGYDASVVEIDRKHKRLKVRAGAKEIEVPASDVRFKKGKTVDVKEHTASISRPDETVSSRINLVGLRVDEALSRLEPFLNHAALAGLSEVTIVHGMGAGILLRAVREHLEGHPLVKQHRSGELQEGGNGVTIVTLA